MRGLGRSIEVETMRPRDLAHSLYDELPPARPIIEPVITTWRDALILLGQVILLGSLMAGLLLVLWLIGAA